MEKHRILAVCFGIIALGFGIYFYQNIHLPFSIQVYFELSFYKQFGALAICIELFIAAIHLFKKHPKVNFTLALFGFTVVIDTLFNLLGIFEMQLPWYAMITFLLCAGISFYLAFTDRFKLGKISLLGAFASFVLGNIIEFFFNI